MATITAYSDDEDLIKIRPNVLQLGVSNWSDHHEEAFDIINRTLIARWYKEVALEYDVDWRETAFDPDKIDADQIKRLSSYKTLELAYLFLMKDGPKEDGFEREHKLFKDRYNEELSVLLGLGINYDWDDDDTIASDESYTPRIRRLQRA